MDDSARRLQAEPRKWNIALSADTKPQQYVAYSGHGYQLTYEQALFVSKAANEWQGLQSRVDELLQIASRAESDVRQLVEDRRKLVEALRDSMHLLRVNGLAHHNDQVARAGAVLRELGEDA